MQIEKKWKPKWDLRGIASERCMDCPKLPELAKEQRCSMMVFIHVAWISMEKKVFLNLKTCRIDINGYNDCADTCGTKWLLLA